MAYRFVSASSSRVQFALPAAFSGYTFGPITLAVLLKRSGTAAEDPIFISTSTGGSNRLYMAILSGAGGGLKLGSAPTNASTAFPTWNTTSWWILATTLPGGGGTQQARLHYHNGTSWTHAAPTAGAGIPAATILSSDLFFVSAPGPWGGEYLGSDVVCAGVKKADSTDLQIETLSATSFSSWAAFGFEWLVGFEAAGTIVNRTTPGSGDETARTSVSLVADPAGWSWTVASTPVANFTGTPTSGAIPLAVTFTDTSTNTPTSWAWTFGDGGTSSSQNPTHTYTTPGTYTVALTATNSAGSNTKTSTAYVTVADAPRPIRILTTQMGWADIGNVTSFVSGTGAPTSAIGATGAVYLDRTSGRMYGPKAAGVWPSSSFGKLLMPGNTYADVLASYTNYAGLLAG